MSAPRIAQILCLVGAVALGGPMACGGGLATGPMADNDQDTLPDDSEDRNRNGELDPGETDPNSSDTDGDGIPDGEEVATQVCAPGNDRPFAVQDVPGADSEVLVDAAVSQRSLLFSFDARNPGAVFMDPDLEVGAAIISRRAQAAAPDSERARVLGRVIADLGAATNPRVRSFVTVQGFSAEQAKFQVQSDAPMSVAAFVNRAAGGMLQNVSLQGSLPEAGASIDRFSVSLLTVQRPEGRIVFVLGAAPAAELSEPARIRLEELTDGTNVASRGSFTRHVCDPFVAEAQAKADILWVVDDSGSMEDDQMAVRAAADAMVQVLEAAQVDFRLGVARMFADRDPNDGRRGRLQGEGFTADVAQFQQDIVVGADGGWEPGLQVGAEALSQATPRTAAGAPADGALLRADAAAIVIHLSDERDQHVECAACGGCDRAEGESRSCTRPEGQEVIDDFIDQYQALGAVTFALVGDLPDGCNQGSGRDDFEPGQGYVEVAAATGGQFGSLCGDMRQNLADVARVATGVSSIFQLTAQPASATLKVAIGPPGQGRIVPRNADNGFEYDPVQNSIIFFGDAHPEEGEEVVIAYRRWDWANNPNTPADPCDECETGSWCDPLLDYELCQSPCGDVNCDPGLICLPDTAACGDPEDLPPAQSPCGECDAGLVCDPSTEDCIPPCEETGCGSDELCNQRTHLCEEFGV